MPSPSLSVAIRNSLFYLRTSVFFTQNKEESWCNVPALVTTWAEFSLRDNVQVDSVVHPASVAVGTGVKIGRSTKLTAPLRIVRKL